MTGASLSLVAPLGFSMEDRYLKRAGLDYWQEVSIEQLEDLSSRLSSGRPIYFFSSKAEKLYTEIPFSKDDYLVFGSETEGLPSSLWEAFPDLFYRIPLLKGKRCLNLSNAVAIVLYESWRQRGFRS